MNRLISIDESGISIEGRASVSSQEDPEEDEGWVEVYDQRRKYREKGLDIVKFGESVFVAKDELVRGDLVIFGGNAMIEGRVGGNVVVIGGNIRARSGAVIKGDAEITASEATHVLITHGTDGMVKTARMLSDIPGKTMVLTGALHPARFRDSDAVFNIGCAIGALQALKHGAWIAMNGCIWDSHQVRKNRDKNRFEAI